MALGIGAKAAVYGFENSNVLDRIFILLWVIA
jgi:hypothetical protein